ALVGVIDRFEELLRIRGMDEHRQLEPSAGVPHRVELRVVELEPRAIRFARREPESLSDLAHANSAGSNVCLELRDRLLRPAWPDVPKVDSGEHADAILRFR